MNKRKLSKTILKLIRWRVWRGILLITSLLACSNGLNSAFDTSSEVKRCSGSNSWEGLLEMDGPLNTNYTKGVGFTPGTGSDVPIEPAADYVNGEYVVYTDARQLHFPNARTDITTYDCSSPELGQALQTAANILGESVVMRFIKPDTTVLSKLEKADLGEAKLQVIVNQHFQVDGHDLLVTWILPPNWNPDAGNRYAPFMFIPGYGHTNNTKLFHQQPPVFLYTYFTALHRSASDNLIMMHINGGGRSSLTAQSGFEQVVNAALDWGENNLGLDRTQIILNGGSRGGFGAMILGGRLAQMEGNQVRGVFASVFGAIGAELSTAFEVSPTYPDIYGGGQYFPLWRDFLYRRHMDADDMLLRVTGVAEPEGADALGPLGSANLLGAASESQAPISVYMAFGSADRVALPSSGHRLFARLKKYDNIGVRADFFLGFGHGAGRETRTELAAKFAALVSDGESATFQTEANYISETAQCHNPDFPPLHLRLPQRTAMNRSSHFDLTGAAGTEYEIRILDATASEVNRLQGVLSEDLFATPEFLTPGQPGRYTIELWTEQNLVGSHTMTVEASLPQRFEELQENWLPKEVPVIYESLNRPKLQCR